MEKISPYFTSYLHGLRLSKSKKPVDIELAVEHFKNALKIKKTDEAYTQLALAYSKLDCVDLYEKTILEAAENGFTGFYSSCGYLYANNKEKLDRKKSLGWFQKGLDAKSAKAYHDLAKLYLSGCKAFEKDEDKAIKLLKEGLELKDKKWSGELAWMLGTSERDKLEYEDAAKHFQLAIDYGYGKANFDLAMLYKEGLGVAKDLDKYLDHLIRHLSVESAMEAAGVFLTGELIRSDLDLAYIFFAYAAEQGNPIAAIMCAAIVVSKPNYDEQLLNKYLDIAFIAGSKDGDLMSKFDELLAYFDEDVCKKLKEYAEEYWDYSVKEA